MLSHDPLPCQEYGEWYPGNCGGPQTTTALKLSIDGDPVVVLWEQQIMGHDIAALAADYFQIWTVVKETLTDLDFEAAMAAKSFPWEVE